MLCVDTRAAGELVDHQSYHHRSQTTTIKNNLHYTVLTTTILTFLQSGQALASSLSLSAFLRILVSHLYFVGRPSLFATFRASLVYKYDITIPTNHICM